MPILELRAGSIVRGIVAGPIAVYDVSVVAIEQLKIPEHSVCFYLEPSVSLEHWQGTMMPVRRWEAGAVGFIPAGSEISSVPDHPYRETFMRIDPALFTAAARDSVYLDRVELTLSEITNPVTSGLCGTLRSLALADGFEQWPLLAESLGLALAVSILKEFCAGPEFARERDALSDQRRKRVLDYIEAGLSGRLSTAELADIAMLSQWHFCRAFRRSMGITPARYVTHRRVALAKHMLRSGQMPIVAIALSCGFSDQSHMTKAFKADVGMTPGAYRRT